MILSWRAVLLPLVLGAAFLAGCTSDAKEPAPADPLPILESSAEDQGAESLGTVFEEKGTGPTTLTVDVSADVRFVQVGGSCSPDQPRKGADDQTFSISWGKSGYATDCDRKGPGASAIIPVKNIGSDHTLKVKIAEGVAWRLAGISVPDPDDE